MGKVMLSESEERVAEFIGTAIAGLIKLVWALALVYCSSLIVKHVFGL